MMKHSHFSSLFNNFYSRFSLRNAPGHVSLYSTAAAKSHRKSWQVSLNLLYRRISRTVYPRASAFSILDQWIQEGRTVDKGGLVSIIKELRHFKNYSQALEVSMWMSDKRYIELLPSDTAIRLDLIAKVHGIEQAENYFNNIPKQLKVLQVYSALLNCYAHAKQLEKAEATMQKLRDLGFARTPLAYNTLLNMYYQTGNREKFDTLMIDMEENGIGCDRYTYGIRLNAAAAASDLEGVNKIMEKCESDPKVLLDWTNYAIAANGYAKAGDVDKALAMLKKSEQLIPSSKRQRGAFEYLMTQYAVLGKQDNTLRLWKHYKERMKVYNRGYICIITSLVKIGDIESAEKIFEEWDSANLNYDIRIPNSLIGAYTRKGLLDKAEAIINRIISKGENPSPTAWNYLAKGYLDHDQIEKAVESTTKTVLAALPGWKLDKDVMVACLEYFRTKADLEGAEEFIKLLGDKNIISLNIQERLLSYIKNEDSNAVALGEMEWHCPKGDEETSVLSEVAGSGSFKDLGSNMSYADSKFR